MSQIFEIIIIIINAPTYKYLFPVVSKAVFFDLMLNVSISIPMQLMDGDGNFQLLCLMQYESDKW